MIPWLTSSVLCDVLITVSLCFYLSSHRSGVNKRTDDLVTRVIRITVQTGLMTSLWAILDLIIYRVQNNSMHLIFNFPLAKIYTNSLMSTLNARRAQNGRPQLPNGSVSWATGSTPIGFGSSKDGFTDTWGFKVPGRSQQITTFGDAVARSEVRLFSSHCQFHNKVLTL